jgi:hypothetical protein
MACSRGGILALWRIKAITFEVIRVIDYQTAIPGIARAQFASVYMDEPFSGHAPLIVDYDYQI